MINVESKLKHFYIKAESFVKSVGNCNQVNIFMDFTKKK